MQSLLEPISKRLPPMLKETLKVRGMALFKVPMLFFASPTVIELTDRRCVVKLPLNRRTRNHLGSMYFGALSVGADCAGALIAWRLGENQPRRISLIFKDFHAEFLKRAEGDVYFTCDDGEVIQRAVDQTAATGERLNLPVNVVATVPSKLGDEPVARFILTLSLKPAKQAK